MGFSAPKPDPAIAAQQAAAAAEAKRNKISSIQDQLGSEDRVRTKLYGARANFGSAPAGQPEYVTSGLRNLFLQLYGPAFKGTL